MADAAAGRNTDVFSAADILAVSGELICRGLLRHTRITLYINKHTKNSPKSMGKTQKHCVNISTDMQALRVRSLKVKSQRP